MTLDEYYSELKWIHDNLNSIETETLDSKLDSLYMFKPVRLHWYLVKAEVEQKKGRSINDIWPMISQHSLEWGGMPGVSEAAMFRNLNSKDDDEWGQLFFYNEYLFKSDQRNKVIDRVEDKMEKFIETGDNVEIGFGPFSELMNTYLTVNEIVLYIICQVYSIWKWQTDYILDTNPFFKGANLGYVRECLLGDRRSFIVINSYGTEKDGDLIVSMLNDLGHKVYLINAPVKLDDYIDVSSKEVTDLCISNISEFDDSTVITPLCVEDRNGNITDNISLMVEYVTQKERFCNVIAPGNVFLELIDDPVIAKNTECLTKIEMFNHIESWNFGYSGDYLKYLSDIYCFDADKELYAETECDFSIVIPARNSAGTLEYTLRTCLNQDYNGTYEIVVSDNSTGGKQEVYDLCQNLNDPRIKYYKTPRDLPLNRSFEFAFLKSRGDFILSIGSDDGICPWGLSILSEIIKEHRTDNIIQWERCYYAWSNFKGADRDKLVIPKAYDRDNINISYIDNIDYFAKVLHNKSNMYSLPTLYINSGCKRDYFKVLLNSTGRILDGCNQDMYLGIMNIAVNKRILNVEYPLTIAGMSDSSLGYVSMLHNRSDKQIKLMNSTNLGSNIGLYQTNGITTQVPLGTGETCSLYLNIYRAIQLGIIPKLWLQEVINYRKMYSDHFSEHSCLDENYDKYLHYALFNAQQIGGDFLEWFKMNIYYPGVTPKQYKPSGTGEIQKKFTEGKNELGGVIIDASKYNASNIEDAANVISSLINAN